jgi:hypothetical protein
MTEKPDFSEMTLAQLLALKQQTEGQLDENPLSRRIEEWLEEINSAIEDLQNSRQMPDFWYMSYEELLSIHNKLLWEIEMNPLNTWAEDWLTAINILLIYLAETFD